MKTYEITMGFYGQRPQGAQDALYFYGLAQLTTAFYRRLALILYREENMPFRQMLSPYSELSGLSGAAEGYLVLPDDPFVLMCGEESFSQLQAAAGRAFSEAAAEVSPCGAGVLEEACRVQIAGREEEPAFYEGERKGDARLRRALHESPLVRPLWDYLAARESKRVCFDGMMLREQEEMSPHYLRRQRAGKMLAVGETARRIVRREDGFVIAAGGRAVLWLCPLQNAEKLRKKLTDFAGELLG